MTIPATQKITLLCTGTGCSVVPACVLSAAIKLSAITAEGAVHATTHALLGRGALCGRPRPGQCSQRRGRVRRRIRQAGNIRSAGRAHLSSAASALPVNYSFATGFAENFGSPSAAPPGANNFSCRRSSAHPYPVILVHGTFGNMNDNWQAASAVLANHGYCVFAFNYGGTSANASPVRVPCVPVLPITGPIGPVPSL